MRSTLLALVTLSFAAVGCGNNTMGTDDLGARDMASAVDLATSRDLRPQPRGCAGIISCLGNGGTQATCTRNSPQRSLDLLNAWLTCGTNICGSQGVAVDAGQQLPCFDGLVMGDDCDKCSSNVDL